jgi:hypothetical protein
MWLEIIIGCVAFSVFVSSGLFDKLAAQLVMVRQQITLLIKLMQQIQDPSGGSAPAVDWLPSDECICVTYTYLGKEYCILAPFTRTQMQTMAAYQAIGVKLGKGDKGEKEDNITQQPGVPYTLSPEEMGYNYIRMINTMTGQSKEYKEPPMYASEISFSE